MCGLHFRNKLCIVAGSLPVGAAADRPAQERRALRRRARRARRALRALRRLRRLLLVTVAGAVTVTVTVTGTGTGTYSHYHTRAPGLLPCLWDN